MGPFTRSPQSERECELLASKGNEMEIIAWATKVLGTCFLNVNCCSFKVLGWEGVLRELVLLLSKTLDCINTHTHTRFLIHYLLYQSQSNTNQQWLQIDLLKTKKITAIATQGSKSMTSEQFVKTYSILYGDQGSEWKSYMTDSSSLTKVPF